MEISLCLKIPFFFTVLSLMYKASFAATPSIMNILNYVQELLMRIGPLISGILFVTAGIVYAIGQLFPNYRRASMHSMAVDIIIGAIILAALSVSANTLANASSHILTNITNAS
ncbi:MAG: hypothetical protein QXL16_00365 [Candidatus Micrarchaeaceae archaeon]